MNKNASSSDKLGSASKLRILAFNPNSIGKNPKRVEVFEILKKKQPDIILLANTRIRQDIEPMVQKEWGGKAFFASYSSQARGVAILFNKNLAVEIKEDTILRDTEGNFLALNFSFENLIVTVACVYGPNQDNPDFYKNIVFPGIKCAKKHLTLPLSAEIGIWF